VRSSGRSGQITLLHFDGVHDRDAAESLRGTLLQVDAEALPDLADQDEYYDHQLVGLRVLHVSGAELGIVADVLHPPASPVLVVARPDGSEELLTDQRDLGRVQRRMHQAAGHHRPCRIEPLASRAQPEGRPVGLRIDDDGAPEPGERRPYSLAAILAGTAIRRFEEQWLDAGVVIVDLANAAEQVHVRGDDVVGRREAMHDPNATDLVTRGEAVVQGRLGA